MKLFAQPPRKESDAPEFGALMLWQGAALVCPIKYKICVNYAGANDPRRAPLRGVFANI